VVWLDKAKLGEEPLVVLRQSFASWISFEILDLSELGCTFV
jgi:hypothetical protein